MYSPRIAYRPSDYCLRVNLVLCMYVSVIRLILALANNFVLPFCVAILCVLCCVANNNDNGSLTDIYLISPIMGIFSTVNIHRHLSSYRLWNLWENALKFSSAMAMNHFLRKQNRANGSGISAESVISISLGSIFWTN